MLKDEIVEKLPCNNSIMGKIPLIEKSTINFLGNNNVIYCENESVIKDSVISFDGSNSLLYISAQKKPLYLNVSLHNNSVFFIGKNSYFNGCLNGICSEQKHIFLGDNCLFSFGIWIRTADAHLIYSIDTMKRINPSKSVYIGDNIWIGQNALIMKGTQVHSGSIIGSGTVLSNQKIRSNCSIGGNPCKIISKNIFWDGRCVHSFTDAETRYVEKCGKNEGIFSYEEKEYIAFEEIDHLFSEKITAIEKTNKIKDLFLKNNQKNRFAYK